MDAYESQLPEGINVKICKDIPADINFKDGCAALDCEMMGLNPQRDRLCLVQVGDGHGNVWLVKFDDDNYIPQAPNLIKLLENKKITKIFHYPRVDMAYLYKYLGVLMTSVYCTKVASRLVRTNTDSHGTKAVVSEFVESPVFPRGQASSYWAADVLDPIQIDYAASDVIYLHEVKKGLDERLKKFEREDLMQACMDFFPYRAKLDIMGWDWDDIFAHNIVRRN